MKTFITNARRATTTIVCVLAALVVGQATAQTGKFTPTGSMSVPRVNHTMDLLPNGRVLVTGGTFGPVLSSAELYEPATGAWSEVGSMNSARCGHTSTLLPNGELLVAGGVSGPGQFTDSAELFNPSTGNWELTGSMSTPRFAHVAVLLPSGRVLVIGGMDPGYNGLATCELYDPSTRKWTATGQLATRRVSHSAVVLSNGTVLTAGGLLDFLYNSPITESAEIYNPTAGLWTSTGPLITSRFGFSLATLPNELVLVEGGVHGNGGSGYVTSVELYDYRIGTFNATSPISVVRAGGSVTVLADRAHVLVAGGKTPDDSDNQSSAELYDIATGTWTATGDMNERRGGQLAALLPDGSVLIVGGVNRQGILSTAELYTPTRAANHPPVASAGPDQNVAAGPIGKATVTLDGTGSTDPDSDMLNYIWTGDFGTVTGPDPMVTFGLGAHSVLLTVSDGKGGVSSDTVIISVKDVTPPTILTSSANPQSLWPPNNKMVPVRVSVSAKDNCDPAPVSNILSVSCNEPLDPQAIQVTGPLTLDLRADRLGNGKGRIYTIMIKCCDAAGNSTTKAVTVNVPHDQSGK